LARNDGIDRTSVRNLAVSDKAVGNTQQHNEREKTAIETPTLSPSALHGTSISKSQPPATPTYSPNWKPPEPSPRAA